MTFVWADLLQRKPHTCASLKKDPKSRESLTWRHLFPPHIDRPVPVKLAQYTATDIRCHIGDRLE